MSFLRFLNVQAYCIITLFIFTTITALAPIAAVAQEVTRAGVSLTDTDAIPGGGAVYSISDADIERQPSDLFDVRSLSDETITAGQTTVQPGTSMLQSFSGMANPESDETFVNEYTVTNTNDSGTGSLRWAVEQTLNNSTRDKISFNIPGNGPHIIQIESQFLSFQHPVIVDATTQPGYGAGSPVIVLDGSLAPEGVNGLVFTVPAGESIVRGFSIVGFKRQTESPFSGGNAIMFFSSGNTVTGNFIGLLPDGTPAGNTGTGIVIQASSSNLIGGRTTADRNVISANLTGIDIRQGSGGNVVEGNYIGTSPDGAEARGNRFNLQIIGSDGNQIGGSAAGAGNVISGALMVETSGGSGVIIAGSGGTPSSNNTVSGNLIGTNAAGTAALPNMRAGILLLFNATNNTIGGATQAHRNIISGNDPYGIFLQASDTSPVSGNIIAGNYIGTDINGGALGNTYGILALGAVGTNRIGHPEYPRNVISGNTNTGIFLAQGNGMIIHNNLIGTSPAGNSAVPNAVDGVYIGTPGNSIGGQGTLEGNVISGNTRHGILISGNAASGNTVARNLIGLNLQGQGGIGNGRYGVNIINAPENLVTGNFITDNGRTSNAAGIEVAGSGATGNVIRANGIGVDATGNQAIGNRGAGILIRASNTMIGGNSSSDGNIISGNTTHGIFITTFQAAGTSQNTIRHNRIGTGIDGQTPLGNTVNGILIDGSSSNMVGGESGLLPAYPNTIAHNGRNGVALTTGFQGEQPYSNAILGNSIYANGLQGIDLGNNGRTANDADDSDDGPNQLQNFPEITDLAYDAVGNQFTLSYSVPSSPTNSGYPMRVEFFLTDGNNQGRTYIGYDTYEEAAFNDGKTIVLPLVSLVTFDENDGITATATDNDFNTSEFADVVPVSAPDPGETGFYVVLNTNDSGEGSLRRAIDQANSNADTARITFNIPGNVPHVIRPQSQYVSFLHPVIIDATSQPGYVAGTPAIVLDGSQAPEGTNALVFTAAAGGSVVRGFSVVGFMRQTTSPFLRGDAIVLLSNGNTVTGNLIGVLPDGTARGNTGTGIVVSSASGNRIGGRNAIERNVISNNATGIDIRSGSENNVVEGNYIGTNPAGTVAMGNRFNVQIISSSGNRIGGTAQGAGNVISAAVMVESSGGSGVVIAGSSTTAASENIVEGNLIGTNASGTGALPNMRAGILLLFNANANTIGGSTPAHRNIISGNGPYGIFMQATETSPVAGNVIAGNYIGLDVNGAALPNNVGLLTFGPVGENFIGHPQYARNVISGNTTAGIQINEGNGLLIRNNYIGTDPAAQSAVPNLLDGILILTSANRIGGSEENEGNVISGNTQHGIRLQGSSASGNVISGNMIGLGADGSTGVGNGRYGIQISGGPENLITGNVISDNGRSSNAAGIELFGAGAQGNLIRANRVGTNATGTAAVGNRGAGILVRAPGNRIGGDDPSDRNIISGNTTHGIFITNFQAAGSGTTTIRNNYIGVAANGTTTVGNTLNGILIDGSSSNMIGGESGLIPAFPNVIAHNGRNGVTLTTGFGDVVPYSNAIMGNSIHSNGLFGIDLGNNGRTPNDADDSDDGPNQLQNFPVISDLTYDETGHQINLTYSIPSSPANSGYPLRVEFFLNDSGNQGRTYIGYDLFTDTDFNNGGKSVQLALLSQAEIGENSLITATATDNDFNTSEFSDALPVITAAGDWVLVDLPAESRLQAIYFTDPLTGWVGGDSGTILKTTDGGNTWSDLTESAGFAPSIIQNIYFHDRHRGWIVGTHGLVARTTNGGLSWTQSMVAPIIFRTVYFLNEQDGFLGGANGAFYKSSDGGKTWNEQPLATSSPIQKITFLSDHTGFILTQKELFKTTDGGQTWSANAVPSGTLLTMHVFDENEVIVAGMNGIMYLTTNGGESFTQIPNPTQTLGAYYNIAFADRNLGWLVGNNGTLAATTDGGTTWELIPTDTANLLAGLFVHNSNYVWASGPFGKLFRYGSAGDVVLEDLIASVIQSVTSSGTFLFNDGDDVTGITITVNDLQNAGTLSVTREESGAENFDWDGDETIDLANIRWEISTEDLAAGTYVIRFDLDDIPGLPEYGNTTELLVLKRDEPGTGTFEVLSSTIDGNSLFVTITGFSEFTIGRVPALVSIDDRTGGIPSAYVLHQNYPNPFNPSTNIRFELPESVPVKLEVFTITGQRVAELVNETRSAGHHTVSFDASLQTSGMYIYRLQAGNFSSTGKMMLIK